jgi:hypothetical protein
VGTLAHLLKEFLHELPSSILPYKKLVDSDNAALRALLLRLPPENKSALASVLRLLAHLLAHARDVEPERDLRGTGFLDPSTSFSLLAPREKPMLVPMNATTLAAVFAPLLCQTPFHNIEREPLFQLRAQRRISDAVQFLIEDAEQIVSDLVL